MRFLTSAVAQVEHQLAKETSALLIVSEVYKCAFLANFSV